MSDQDQAGQNPNREKIKIDGDIVAKVTETIKNQLNVNEEQIKPEASFLNDLKADSLDTVELVMAFEEVFEIEHIPEGDAEKLQTVYDVMEYVQLQRNKKS